MPKISCKRNGGPPSTWVHASKSLPIVRLNSAEGTVLIDCFGGLFQADKYFLEGNDLSYQFWLRFIATGFFLGKAPKAPGTVGTFAALPFIWGFQFLNDYTYMIMAFVLTVFAVVIAQLYETTFEVHDSSEIVIDEVAGFVVAMTWLPLTWQSLLLAFVIFRILDSLKPFPIGWLDRRVEGGLGVVADDIVAGIITNVALQFIFLNTDWLGWQLTI